MNSLLKENAIKTSIKKHFNKASISVPKRTFRIATKKLNFYKENY